MGKKQLVLDICKQNLWELRQKALACGNSSSCKVLFLHEDVRYSGQKKKINKEIRKKLAR